MFLLAQGTVLGYRYGDVFEIDDNNPAEVALVDPYLAGGLVVKVTDPGRPAESLEAAALETPIPDVDLSKLDAGKLRALARDHHVDIGDATRVGELRTLIGAARTARAIVDGPAGAVAADGPSDPDAAPDGPDAAPGDSGASPQPSA